jgi:hypothetical protein
MYRLVLVISVSLLDKGHRAIARLSSNLHRTTGLRFIDMLKKFPYRDEPYLSTTVNTSEAGLAAMLKCL